ncbi:MAG: SIS domain-containing protein [Candidatus Thermoplasmatota archaeon]|jgi:glucose/mannose-6-phosphate isomerase
MTLLHNDPTGFVAAIQRKAELLQAGHEAGRDAAPAGLRADGLLFTGMGFSGFAADLVRDAATRDLDIPFTVIKHYQFPHHVKPGWHTIAMSYSGDTEETLAVTKEALRRGVDATAFTTGGTLSKLVKRVVPQPRGYQPRAAFAHNWFSVLGFLEGSGLLKDRVPVADCAAAVKDVDKTCGPDIPEDANEAMQLARQLAGPVPKIYATPSFHGVATHFRGTLNENAKKIAEIDLVPECNHNDLTGWGGDVENRRHYAVVCLSHTDQNPEMLKRLAFMEKSYRSWGVPWHNKTFRGLHAFREHVVEQARAVQFFDYVSVYVAALRGQDPANIRDIAALKAFLRKDKAV